MIASNSLARGARPALTSPNGSLNPDEVRRLIKTAAERGFVRLPGQTGRIDKNGFDLANLGNVRSQWMDVTPAMAAAWLKNNFGNRPVRQDTVKAYARDMLNGAWVPTHQGLAFNDRDVLIDGQHRLHAIVMCGATVRLMVTFGLPSRIEGKEVTTMDAVDRGATRSVADQLTIQHGFSNGSITASVCSAIASLCFGERTRRLSVAQTLEVFRAFEPAVLYVIAHRSKQVGLRTTGVLAGFAFALMTGPQEQYWERPDPKGPPAAAPDCRLITPSPDRAAGSAIARMFAQVVTGEHLQEGSPIARLRAFLTSEEAKLFTRSLDRGLAELVLQAIHLELQGRTVDKLEMGLEGADAFRALQQERVAKIASLFKLPARAEESKAAAPAGPAVPAESAPAKQGRPSLDRVMDVVEAQFKVARQIIAGRGTDEGVAFPREAFVNLALSFGYQPELIGGMIRRTAEAVMKLQWPPRKHMGQRRQQAIDELRSKLGG